MPPAPKPAKGKPPAEPDDDRKPAADGDGKATPFGGKQAPPFDHQPGKARTPPPNRNRTSDRAGRTGRKGK